MVAVMPRENGAVSRQAVIEAECGMSAAASCSRVARLFELRRAIESGEYQISAFALAEALLRAARSAN